MKKINIIFTILALLVATSVQAQRWPSRYVKNWAESVDDSLTNITADVAAIWTDNDTDSARIDALETNQETDSARIDVNETAIAALVEITDSSYVSATITTLTTNNVTLENGATVTNSETDTLKLTETVIAMIGRLVADLMFLTPSDTATAVEGTIYYDADTDNFYGRNSSAWVLLDTQ